MKVADTVLARNLGLDEALASLKGIDDKASSEKAKPKSSARILARLSSALKIEGQVLAESR